MSENMIRKLMEEIETYKQAIQETKDLLAATEMELDGLLEQEYGQEEDGQTNG